MKKLLVYQSLWAMERRHTDGYERTLDENLDMIREAGFDGVSFSFEDRDLVRRITAYQRPHGMSSQAMCFPTTVDALKPVVETAEEFGANHINIQPDVRPYRVQDCVAYLEGWRRLAEQTSIPVYIETHRDRMTTDLFLHPSASRLLPRSQAHRRYLPLRRRARVRMAHRGGESRPDAPDSRQTAGHSTDG